MTKQTLLAAMLAATAFAANAGTTTTTSHTVVVDNFNTGDQSISYGAGSAIGTKNSDTNSIRTLTSTLLTSSPPVQALAQVNSGVLDITNGSGENTNVVVSWDLSANLLPTSAMDTMFSMMVVQSDANPTSMVFALDGKIIGDYSLPGNVNNQIYSFDLGGFDLSSGGTLTMTLNGSDGWDMTLDSLGISYDTQVNNVPEPASLALVGISLLGMGAARRAKRARV